VIITHAGDSRWVGKVISGVCELVCMSVSVCVLVIWMSAAKMAEPIQMLFAEQTKNDALDGVFTGATWQIWLNDPYSPVMPLMQ